ncbi:uncharacterized protein LOC132256176 isoform X2 [Phlebotomus argentipes]|uniref:uncharacterized protein LOC132256176 isoform X2 n=1 Tax=Phlebotomus argentipes TaxID=94469 RepID=UPI0028930B05|nr:uncharacterized protein LOC132256176 isoform X2 [Phlebotomus argentipes]
MGKSKLFFSTRLLFPTAATLCLLIQSVHPQPPQTGVINPCILDQILNLISIPDDGYDIHRIALRNRLRSILERAIDDSDYQRLDGDGSEGDFLADKRSINSLARAGLFPKRNLGSVLRTGGFQRTGGENGGGGKRSLASLAKTGQLPSKEPDAEIAPSSLWLENKRNLGALARSGNFYLTGKRNLAALARGNLLPLAKREWIEEERRSIGALARDWALPNQKNKDEEEEELKEKKNIGALKNSPIHGVRQKRQASYTDFEDGTFEVPEPVVQTSPVDYEDILESLNSLNSNAHFEDKRYLASMARNGWLRSFRPKEKRHVGSLARFGLLRSDLESNLRQMPWRRMPEKRHIGALARSGWFSSSFRPARGGRFSRSGRARTDFPSNPTDVSNLSPTRVDDALLSFSRPSAGQRPDSSTGARRPDSPATGAAASGSPSIELPADEAEMANDIIDFYPLPAFECVNCFPPLLI